MRFLEYFTSISVFFGMVAMIALFVLLINFSTSNMSINNQFVLILLITFIAFLGNDSIEHFKKAMEKKRK